MQGQKSSVESLPETFEFDHGSSSNNSGLDTQIYWNNMLNQIESQNIVNYILPPGDTNMPYVNMVDQESASLSIWNTGGPSYSEPLINQGRNGETKMERDWTSLTVNAGSSLRIEERRFDAANMLASENVNNMQSFSQNSISNDVLQDPEHNAGNVGIRSEISDTGLPPHPISGLLKLEHAPSSSGSSNPCRNSSADVGFMSEDGDDRPGSSLDGRRLACKRKNIEGFPGQSSASGSTSLFPQNENSLLHSVPANHGASTGINLSTTADYLSGANSSEEWLNPRFGTIARGVAPDCYPFPSATRSTGSSNRNFRVRINPAHQHDISLPNLYAQGNAISHSSVWLPNQPSSLLIPVNQSLEARPVVGSSTSQGQPHIPIVPGLPRTMHAFPWNGASSSRIGSSSSSRASDEIGTRDETNSRSIPRNNFPEHSAFVPAIDTRHLVQDPMNWSLANGSISMAGNVAPPSRTGTSSGIHPSVGPSWVPRQNPPAQNPRSLPEVVHRSFLPSDSSDSGGQNSSFSLHHSGHSSTSQEMGYPSGVFHGHQQPYMRSASLMERQNAGFLGVPLSRRTLRSLATAREGRSRMVSEQIRNALNLMRRRDGLRFEDVFILDPSLFYGGADLHDRHRDMRLDVDNMSYEELLALEERIGNVSTGLSGETVLKCLKRRKHSPMTAEGSVEEEPCCICQEEYMEGDDLGALDCGHEFHTACIKQWLMHKNLCPICKTTALVT